VLRNTIIQTKSLIKFCLIFDFGKPVFPELYTPQT